MKHFANSIFFGFGVFKRTYRDFQMALLQLKTLNLLCKRYLYDFISVFHIIKNDAGQ
jgi:hypothetical protein